MRIRYLLLLLLVVGCEPQQETSTQDVELPVRPNILWLVAEDMSPYIPAFGDSTVETPNLSRLANEGVRYTNVYSPSGVCAPSRYALATGTYPTSGGGHNMRTLFGELEQLGLIPYQVVPPPDVKMMSQVLREHGYYASNNSKTDYQFVHTATAWDESGIRAHWRGRADDQPFFSVFNFDITHESQFFGPPMKRNLRFSGSFPDNVRNYPWGERLDSADWVLNVPEDLEVNIPPYLPNTEVVKNDMRVMYSNIIEMDRQVGFLLDQLEADGQLENTIVVWYTDHGGPLPRGKRLMYDSGLKVPMIIRYPDKLWAGTVDDQMISFVDFAPTTFSFAGIPIPDYIEGQAFAGAAKADTPRDYIFAAVDRLDEKVDMIRAARDSRFKYLRNFYPDSAYYLPLAYRERIGTMQELLRLRDLGELNEVQMQWFRKTKPEEELFDTWEDPHEINDLAADPAYSSKLQELRAACNQWMEEMQDKGIIPEAELISSFWPNNEQPSTSDPVVAEEGNQISLNAETEGAGIGYQIVPAGEEMGTIWTPYTEPLQLEEGETLFAIADRIGYKPSRVVRYDVR